MGLRSRAIAIMRRTNSLFQEELASNTFRVNRMPPFSRVIAQVRAYDHLLQAWCDWGPEKEFRTLPKALVRTHVGETSVDVSWSRNPRVVSAVTDEDLEAGTEDPLAPTNVLKYVVRLNKVDASGQHREVCKYHYDRSQPSMATIGRPERAFCTNGFTSPPTPTMQDISASPLRSKRTATWLAS